VRPSKSYQRKARCCKTHCQLSLALRALVLLVVEVVPRVLARALTSCLSLDYGVVQVLRALGNAERDCITQYIRTLLRPQQEASASQAQA